MSDNSVLTITLVQMDCQLGKPAENFAHAEELIACGPQPSAGKAIAEAAGRGSDLVMLPELWSTAYDLEHAADHAASLALDAKGTGWFARMAKIAKRHGIWLTGSMLEANPDGRFYNCMALYDPAGRLAAIYRKIHLFRLMEEEVYLAPGPQPTLADLPWGKTGLAICYDLRFPELFRGYALQGARLMLLPAEWPHPRREHWRTLLRARAIENQCFVAACNRVGSSKGTAFFGASAVINPWGETLGEADESETLITVTVDLAQADAARRQIPVFADRRPDLYDADMVTPPTAQKAGRR